MERANARRGDPSFYVWLLNTRLRSNTRNDAIKQNGVPCGDCSGLQGVCSTRRLGIAKATLDAVCTASLLRRRCITTQIWCSSKELGPNRCSVPKVPGCRVAEAFWAKIGHAKSEAVTRQRASERNNRSNSRQTKKVPDDVNVCPVKRRWSQVRRVAGVPKRRC